MVGQTGSEDGTIRRDEVHPDGARITIEERTRVAPFAITCGIYGWMAHTCYASSMEDAERLCGDMKWALEGILEIIPMTDDPACEEKEHLVICAIEHFVNYF